MILFLARFIEHRVAEKQLPLLPRIHGDQNRAISEKLSLLHRYRKPRPPIPVVKRRGRIPKQKKWQEDGRDTNMFFLLRSECYQLLSYWVEILFLKNNPEKDMLCATMTITLTVGVDLGFSWGVSFWFSIIQLAKTNQPPSDLSSREAPPCRFTYAGTC